MGRLDDSTATTDPRRARRALLLNKDARSSVDDLFWIRGQMYF